MVKVEVLSDLLVEATSSHYITGWKGEVSNELASRHGSEGTGIFKELPEDAELTPLPELLPKAIKSTDGKKIKK
ncbi:hypothetical protein WAE58_21790 [Pedobacter panaciterrae]|uniref:Uncharacterized protein n=1 Tax=Pedobacter panaciterrae TaxID=363849 RepID=A0ABU8NT45_9SPHI